MYYFSSSQYVCTEVVGSCFIVSNFLWRGFPRAAVAPTEWKVWNCCLNLNHWYMSKYFHVPMKYLHVPMVHPNICMYPFFRHNNSAGDNYSRTSSSTTKQTLVTWNPYVTGRPHPRRQTKERHELQLINLKLYYYPRPTWTRQVTGEST